MTPDDPDQRLRPEWQPPTGPQPPAAWQPAGPPPPPAVWPQPRRWSAARTPAFWLTVVPVALGMLAIAVLGLILALWTPHSALAAGGAVTGYAAVWVLLLVRWIDPVERRPAWLVLLALGWGATVAVAAGGGSGYFLDDLVARGVSVTFSAEWGAALTAPTAEEPAKAAGVVLLLLAARPYLTTAWSGAVYGALVGVGFAAVEDFGYALVSADAALPDDVTAAMQTTVLRFLVPGFAGHQLFTALFGAGVGYAWLRRGVSGWRRAGLLAAAFGGAWLMHASVNSPLAVLAADRLADTAGAGILTGYFLTVGATALVPLIVLARLRRHDAVVVLSRACRTGAIRPDEVDTLARLRNRGQATAAPWSVPVATVLLAASLVGLVYWPAAIAAAVAAATLAVWSWRRPLGRLATVAAVAGLVCGYVWLASWILTLMFPSTD